MSVEFAKVVSRRMLEDRGREGADNPIDNSMKRPDDGTKTNMAEEMSGSGCSFWYYSNKLDNAASEDFSPTSPKSCPIVGNNGVILR